MLHVEQAKRSFYVHRSKI